MVLGLEWWRKYSPNLDFKAGVATGSFANGRPWSLPLISRDPLRGPLNSIKVASPFHLPDEFCDYAHLFEPRQSVPLPDAATHMFSF